MPCISLLPVLALCSENKCVTPWKGSIRAYKKHLAKKMGVTH
jgi:hypothetical protein